MKVKKSIHEVVTPTKRFSCIAGKKSRELISSDLKTESIKYCFISKAIDNSENDMIKVVHKDEVLFHKRDELLQTSIENDIPNNLENHHEPNPEQDVVNQIIIHDDS